MGKFMKNTYVVGFSTRRSIKGSKAFLSPWPDSASRGVTCTLYLKSNKQQDYDFSLTRKFCQHWFTTDSACAGLVENNIAEKAPWRIRNGNKLVLWIYRNFVRTGLLIHKVSIETTKFIANRKLELWNLKL